MTIKISNCTFFNKDLLRQNEIQGVILIAVSCETALILGNFLQELQTLLDLQIHSEFDIALIYRMWSTKSNVHFRISSY